MNAFLANIHFWVNYTFYLLTYLFYACRWLDRHSLFHSPSIRSPLPQELPLFFSSQSVFFHSPPPFLPVLGSVLHGRLGGFEVHLDFSAQAPLFLSLFCCNLIGWSHCSARNHISLNEEHHTCLLFPLWLEYALLNPKRGGVRDHGKGEKSPWRLSALDMSLFPPKSIHHLNRADMFRDSIHWKGGKYGLFALQGPETETGH